MAREVLGARALNRATLARQLLLERSELGVEEAIAQVAGLQAQFVKPVHAGLWSRLRRFAAEELTALAAERRVVRATLMRHTLHVVTAADYLAFRHVVQPGVARAFESMAGRRVADVDRDRVLAAARERLRTAPATAKELRDLLADLEPDADISALGYLTRSYLELVQLPSGGGWGWPPVPQHVLAPNALGAEPARDADPAALLRRYLAAFGPASVQDMQVWSGVPALKATVDALRGELVSFADERGRELLDLPDAPRPGDDVDAPVRLLPEFDNLVVAHHDRTRLMTDDVRKRVSLAGARVLPTILVDGRVAGTWRLDVKAKVATLTITPFVTLTKAQRADATIEATGMAALLEPGARDQAVVFAPG